MEEREFNTFKFFRRYFHFPKNAALQWCIVQETCQNETELRLGVLLKGTDLYVDVAMRRFFHQIDTSLIRRRCFPAQRISRAGEYEYRTSEGWVLSLPKNYIPDLYLSSVFDKDLIKSRFF